MKVYVDTSFLVSSFSADTNSTLTETFLVSRATDLWVTTFTELEFMNALGLRVFRNQITAADAQSSQAAFEHDLRVGIFVVKPLPEGVFARARQLSRQTTPRLGTRTSDILHVAAALELGADEFYTFDRQQAKLAGTVKLKTNSLS